MIEFGEKIKKLREEKGMTQQTMAEKLYVTRQAVSRWECGARYPDLLTAKKIAQILEVSIDELVSGEELQKNIEKEPILVKPSGNILQTVLYTIALVAYALMCVFSIYSLFPSESLKDTPAGRLSMVSIVTMTGYLLNFAVLVYGIVLSVKNKLDARKTGLIMTTPYAVIVVTFLAQYVDMKIKNNGNWSLLSVEFLFPLLAVLGILLYFYCEEKRLPYLVIVAICVFSLGEILYGIKIRLSYITELGVVVKTVHGLGKVGLVILLGYQGYVLNKKRGKALKI